MKLLSCGSEDIHMAISHLGYDPQKMLTSSNEEWERTFDDKNPEPHRTFFSIINSSENEHIGEAQLFIDDALGDAQLSVLIGRKDLWHLGYGSSSVITLMDHAFKELDLYRVWVDIQSITHARNMFESLGFQHEGTLRQSRLIMEQDIILQLWACLKMNLFRFMVKI